VPEVAVQVAPLPAVGRPPDFGGLVDSVQVVTRLAPEAIPLGGATRLWIVVRGAGNLWVIPSPLAEDALPGVDLFPERPALEIDAENELRVRRTFRYQLVPRREGRVLVPEVAIPYFDPGSGRYRAALGPARTLLVTPAQGDAAQGDVPARLSEGTPLQ
jgi:hypothetical protein